MHNSILPTPPRIQDLTGRQFSKWTVLGFVGRKNHSSRWLCRCECGETKTVAGNSLKNQDSTQCKSCSLTTHDNAYSPTYISWQNMIQRCHNPNNPNYKSYGKRGIYVCTRWRARFENFLADMGERPDGKTIDRIDGNGSYVPANCRWATRTEQQRNQRNNVNITHNGKTQCISAWAKEYGLHHSTLDKRIRLGWPIEKALTAALHR